MIWNINVAIDARIAFNDNVKDILHQYFLNLLFVINKFKLEEII